METALENLAGANLNNADLMKMFGRENLNAARILIDSRQEFVNYTAAVTGSNTAVEQAITNTNNNAAALAQARNRAELQAITLGEKLAPALTFSTNAFSYMIKVLVAIVENFDTFVKWVKISAFTVTAYVAVTKGAEIATKSYALAVQFAQKVQELFNKSMKSNPWGLIAAAVTAVGTALVLFRDEMNKSAVSVADFTAEVQKESTAMNELFSVVKSTSEGTEARRDAVQKLNTTYGKYLPNLLSEASSLQQIEAAQKAANRALVQSIALKMKEQDISAALSEQIESEKDSYDEVSDILSEQFGTSGALGAAMGVFQEQLRETLAEGEEFINQPATLANRLARKIANELDGVDYGMQRDLVEATRDIFEARMEFAKDMRDIENFYGGVVGDMQEAANAASAGTPSATGGDVAGLPSATGGTAATEGGRGLAKSADDLIGLNFNIEKYLASLRELEETMLELELPELNVIDEEDAELAGQYWLENFRQTLAGRKQLLKMQLDSEEISYREYLDRVTALEQAAQMERLEGYQATFSAIGNLFGQFKQEYKALALAEIAANTAAAISALVKHSQANPLNTLTFGAAGTAQYLTGLAQILGNIASAKAILSEGFYFGGYTKQAPSDSAPVGVVHANEYVVPADGTRNPTLAPLLSVMEDVRQSGQMRTFDFNAALGATQRTFAQGGATTPPINVNASLSESEAMRSTLQQIAGLLQNPPAPQLSMFQIREELAYLDKIDQQNSR